MHQIGSGENLPISDRALWTVSWASSTCQRHRSGFTIHDAERKYRFQPHPRWDRNLAQHPSTHTSHASQLELPLFFLGFHRFFGTSRLALFRIAWHHPVFSHGRSHHILSPPSFFPRHHITSGHTSHRIVSTRTIYLFHALSFDTKQPISPQQNKNKAWIVKSTSMSRTYTMGLLVPGPLFGGQHWRRD
jgi:hypothetical protein